MGKLFQRCGLRAAVVLCAWPALAWALAPAALSASEVLTTDDFRVIAAAAERYVDQYGPEHVLFVVDIDNTLLAMNHALGSDQWFDWQDQLLKSEPDSPLLVAKTFDGLLEVQGLLYNLGQMHPPQQGQPAIVRRMQDLGLYTLVLTSRGDEFRAATKRELLRNGYDLLESALAVRGVRGGARRPYNPANPQAAGFTPEEIESFDLNTPRRVSYADGIFMGAGQHKGAMLVLMLHHAIPEIKAIVFADDHQRNIDRVVAAVTGRGIEITAFRCSHEDENVAAFHNSDKQDVDRRWRCLDHTLELVFE